MSRRFSFRDLPGGAGLIEKTGDAAALAREAAALARLAGQPWAPALIDHGPGRLVTARLPGAPRELAGLGARDAALLGSLLAGLHALERSEAGGLWWWDVPATTLGEYRARRAADADAVLAATPDAGLATRALARPLPGAAAPGPFRMVHGDLVASNVVWGPDGAGLVDWEFWRMGDPAEDLAYLIVVNDLPPPAAAAVLQGYGDPGMPARVEAWAALAAVDAGAWFLAEGMRGDAAPLLARARRSVAGGG